jgi:glycosyltransferase involved in cell wall biosynthesis
MNNNKEFKVIVLAFACSPYRGSEGKVGWEGVLAISSFAEVYVLTAAHCRSEWEKAWDEGIAPSGVKVEFFGSVRPWHANRLVARGQSWLRYVSFMKKVRRALPRLVREIRPDLIHHLTYATWRVPTEVWRHGIPSIWGPIGGSGEVPQSFRQRLSRPAKILETLRRWQGKKVAGGRKFRAAMNQVSLVIAANEETKELLQNDRGNKPLEVLPVAYLSKQRINNLQRPQQTVPKPESAAKPNVVHLFAGGNIEGRKGLEWALQALAQVKELGISFRYIIAGGGPDIGNLKERARALGISGDVIFHPGYRGAEYLAVLKTTDIFLMPSFRETLGMTCQEAILSGCYPLVANLSAQGEMARVAGIQGVSVENEDLLVSELVSRIKGFAADPVKFREEARIASEKLAVFFSKDRYLSTMREAYRSVVGRKS